ncbi:hypothetical protein ROZALSC1DRAFT_25701 [Rozella allomycis CSF55]|uniref:Uncharacterized protein n=1 Tax=Rozella allomycis (strain CSF55) TaxID=988480 RepID=A0A4V1IYX4_ROZAC|nr:hypothetical protein ROZALSC1DRAFT_25701 [Rozella allomycis CSF55]
MKQTLADDAMPLDAVAYDDDIRKPRPTIDPKEVLTALKTRNVKVLGQRHVQHTEAISYNMKGGRRSGLQRPNEFHILPAPTVLGPTQQQMDQIKVYTRMDLKPSGLNDIEEYCNAMRESLRIKETKHLLRLFSHNYESVAQ